jgi:hypothetical protein
VGIAHRAQIWRQNIKSSVRWWIAGYVVLFAAVFGSMLWARHTALSQLSSNESRSNWQAWRDDVREQHAGDKGVERRVPKSDEPPALVLMRDRFVVMLIGALLFSSVLYWIIAWFVTGILKEQ